MDVDMNIADIPTDPDRRWEWIKFQLRMENTSLAKIARDLNVTGSAVKNAKRLPYPSVERAISAALGLAPAQIWPERWDSNGTPVRYRPNLSETRPAKVLKDSAAYDLGHCKKVREV